MDRFLKMPRTAAACMTFMLMMSLPLVIGQSCQPSTDGPGDGNDNATTQPAGDDDSAATQPAEPEPFTVLTSVVGQGQVILNPPGGIYSGGQTVRLTAIEKQGWEFARWEGDGSGNSPTITVRNEGYFVAVFTAIADTDADGIPDEQDNCPYIANPDQADLDGDGLGNVCEPDADQDGVPDDYDNCVTTANPSQADDDGDGIGNACDPVEQTQGFDVLLGASIVASDNRFLGIINKDASDPQSIANPNGNHGAPTAVYCIWNPYNNYGSNLGTWSPFNPNIIYPPRIKNSSGVMAWLTVNTDLTPRVNPNDLARFVGRSEQARD